MDRWLFRLLMALLICTGMNRPASAEVPLDTAGFTAYLAKAFGQANPGAEVSVTRSLELHIQPASGDGFDALLDTIYSMCQRAPAACEQNVAIHVAPLSAGFTQPDPAPDRAAVRAIVRPDDYMADVHRTLDKAGGPVAVHLPGGLWMLCVLDQPQAIQVLRPQDLKTLGLTPDQAIALAKQNLAANLGPLEVPGGHGKSKVVVLAGDPYESSRFVLADSWAPLAERFGGTLLVTLASTDAVLYSGDDTAKGIAALSRRAQKIAMTAQRPLPPMIFRWTRTGWEPV